MTKRCPYCGESVHDDAYVDHLAKRHDGELSRIDRRLVGDRAGAANDRSRRRHLYVGGGIILMVFALGYLAIFSGAVSSDPPVAQEPDREAPMHVHGTITVAIDGEEIDFDQARYIERDVCFHFHGYDDAEVWHAHCEGLTLEYALWTIDMDVSDDEVTIEGETYSVDDPDTTVELTVNGEEVDPETYELEGVGPTDEARDGAGDDIRLIVETDD